MTEQAAGRKVGIRDVAHAAGVSVTTVSHVLNETPHTRTSEQTRARVREVATRLGYSPNRLARGLRTRTSGMIGLLTEEIATTPHAGQIILGAQESASERNLTLAIVNSHLSADAAARRADARALIDRQVDGIIYATVYQQEIAVPSVLRSAPTVLIGAVDHQGLVPAVLPDERAGVRASIDLLAAEGHTQIGFVNASEDVPATRGRLLGYQDGLSLRGIAGSAELVANGPGEAPGGYRAARELLDRPDRPTAIVCYNDRMAWGVYTAAAEMGLRIPRDLSIIGFDDQAPIPESLFPRLTTVALPHYEMGAWAVQTLLSLIDGTPDAWYLATHPTYLACPLVERESVDRADPGR